MGGWQLFRLLPPPRLARLKEGEDVFVDLFGLLDKDQVRGPLKHMQFGTRNGFGEGAGIGDRHVAVVGAVNHERW